MSDLYSRQISFSYERDTLLRRFPVPRVDIDEAQIVLNFAIRSVELDPARATSRNAAISARYDQTSMRLARAGLDLLAQALRSVSPSADEVKQTALAQAEKRLLAEEYRDAISGRLMQYFNESTEQILSTEGELNIERVLDDLVRLRLNVLRQPDIERLHAQFTEVGWLELANQERDIDRGLVKELADEVAHVFKRYPDFRITLEMDPEKIKTAGLPLSTITIKSSVRDYRWSKVDVDKTDMRNVRTLNPE
jgi:hypothetical protein